MTGLSLAGKEHREMGSFVEKQNVVQGQAEVIGLGWGSQGGLCVVQGQG